MILLLIQPPVPCRMHASDIMHDVTAVTSHDDCPIAHSQLTHLHADDPSGTAAVYTTRTMLQMQASKPNPMNKRERKAALRALQAKQLDQDRMRPDSESKKSESSVSPSVPVRDIDTQVTVILFL